MASIYANLLEKKKAFTWEKSSTPRGFSGCTNMAAVSLFWNTNMAAVTSCENALSRYHGNVTSHFSSPQEMSTRRPLHVRIHWVWIFLFQSQGQENDIILVSLVRSNKEGVIGYLASMDRLCVAISRARCGLYLFGNHAHLSQKSMKGWKVCNRDYLRFTVPAHGYV